MFVKVQKPTARRPPITPEEVRAGVLAGYQALSAALAAVDALRAANEAGDSTSICALRTAAEALRTRRRDVEKELRRLQEIADLAVDDRWLK
jgi:hypothetical protein